MPALSKLVPAGAAGLRRLVLPAVHRTAMPVRCMGGDAGPRKMLLIDSRFSWNKFKDLVIFYTSLVGGITLTGIFLANIYVGPGTLSELPTEGPAPGPEEYYKSPVTRFVMKYLVTSMQKAHELRLSRLLREREQDEQGQAQRYVARMMDSQGDGGFWIGAPYIESEYVYITAQDAKSIPDSSVIV